MSSIVRHYSGGSGNWRGVAVGILLLIGALASVGGLLGQRQALFSDSISYVGSAAVAALAVSVGKPVAESTLGARATGAAAATIAEDQPRSDARLREAPLELYHAEGCPYCRKVRRFCTDEGISIPLDNPRTAGSLITNGAVTNRHRHRN